MHYTQHTSNNGVLGAPINTDQETNPVSALPITREIEVNVPVVKSFWLPEKEELEAINRGLPIMITQVGITISPMRVEVAATK